MSALLFDLSVSCCLCCRLVWLPFHIDYVMVSRIWLFGCSSDLFNYRLVRRSCDWWSDAFVFLNVSIVIRWSSRVLNLISSSGAIMAHACKNDNSYGPWVHVKATAFDCRPHLSTLGYAQTSAIHCVSMPNAKNLRQTNTNKSSEKHVAASCFQESFAKFT